MFFFVPETKGVPIEEMDKLFGGNAGEDDLRRIANIRARLGIGQTEDIRRASIAQGIDTAKVMPSDEQSADGKNDVSEWIESKH